MYRTMKLTTHLFFGITILALSVPQTLAKEEALSISPAEFMAQACKSASDVEACTIIVKGIIVTNPRDEDLDATKVAVESARQVQSQYEETAESMKELIKESKLDAKIKNALSNCCKMYSDISHAMGLTLSHLKKDNEVCKARDFASSADANPKLCEDQLVQAGTTGEKLKLYKDFNDLQDMAGACDSIIAYMIETKGLKSAQCKKD